MRTKPITSEDRELIRDAERVLEEFHVPGQHRCSAALRTASGDIYTAINLIAGGQADVHSEQVAFGRAVMDGATDIETSAAVVYEDDDASKQMQVVSACGHCREFFRAFAPNVDVLVPGDGDPEKAPLSELLPAKR